MNYFQQISGIEGECDTEDDMPNDTVKEDDHSDRNNYREISLAINVCRSFTAIFINRLLP